jgi:hypothetical protein
LEKYPELVTTIEIDKQRRVDSMRLSSRLDQDKLYDEKIRIGTTAPPSARKIKALQFSETTKSLSPTLKAKQSASDLMFQMDDESAMSSPTPTRKGKTFVLGSISDDLGDMFQGPSPSLFSNQEAIPSLFLSHGESLGDPTSLDDRLGSIDSGEASSLLGSLSPLSRGAPWASPVVSGNKRDLKDIMTETSQSRISNLTLGMSDRSDTSALPGSNNFSQKMSQRERKKLQQQIQAQEQLAAQQREADARQSPWQPIGKKPSRDIKEDPSSQSSLRPSSQAKISRKPSMTLRQTVAGASSPQPTPSEPGPSNSKQSRSVSQPTTTLTTSSAGKTNKQKPAIPPPCPSSPASAQPIIQSIRHTTHSRRSVSGAAASSSLEQQAASSSLASILLQQQAEKDEIREAATAKHNLQDIQAEQEFQEWWDKESRRVMEAEANAAATTTTTTSNNTATREGKGRQRRKNRGQPQSQQQQQQQQQQQKQGPGNKQPQQPQGQGQQGAPPNEKPSHRRPRKSKAQSSSTGLSKT